MRWIITYDITDPRRLRRVERTVSGFAIRLQDSVFEGDFDGVQLQELQTKLRKIIRIADDTVRYYPVCARDLSQRIVIAVVEPTICGGSWIV